MSEAKTIDAMAKELWKCQERYEDFHREAQQASNRETDALNALNKAQRDFDAMVLTIKKGSPKASDWHAPDRGARGFVASEV